MANRSLYTVSKDHLSLLTHNKAVHMTANADKQADIPVLSGCYNVISNLRTVMSGSVMQLEGINLSFDRQDIQQGLFMVDFAGNTCKINTIVRIKTDSIIFMIPGGLIAGIYKLELRKRSLDTEVIYISTLPSVIRVII